MKKSLAIILAFFIVFAPVYSNAVLPALVASAASATRVLVGSTIKKIAPQALANATKAGVGICKSNPATCKALGLGVGGVIGAITSDGWEIEITNNDVTNIDVDIYKLPPNEECEIQFGWGLKKQTYQAFYADYLALFNDAKPYPDALARFPVRENILKSTSYKGSEWRRDDTNVPYQVLVNNGSGYYGISLTETTNLYYRCVPSPTNKIYITNNELNEYVTNNTTNNDIDIKDIYNFDFSQYNINIGGNTYNGTTINNDLSKSDPSEADKKVSPDLKNKLDNKTISLDDVNDQNCTKNESGEYDKCGDSAKEPEEPTDPENPTQPEPPPIECNANGFYKKVCDWMDWTQEEPEEVEPEQVEIEQVEAENSNKIDMAGECPAPYQLNFDVLGYQQNHSISYEPLCGALVLLKPIFVGSGALSGMFILMGYSRASNTGVNS